MEFQKYLSLWALALVTVLAFYGSYVEACMCMPAHPQTHYCNADYVVQVRVLRKSEKMDPGKTIYKVNIKRTYKATPEARKMLRDGRLATPNMDSSCGVKLQLGKVYIIAGRMPQLNLCSYFKEYAKMTITERHGFNGGYKKTCSCNVWPCFGKSCLDEREADDGCKWSPHGNCERDFSACMPHIRQTPSGNITRCRWRRTRLYKQCLNYP
ncbi:tissue inhibitor of metalloproteinase [Scaptodrosophila lebanonensis]|uniref:Tissue inhibitor of metalloproteinase n=1 Tax=Drosophila lebanonensis TaxID=7225 RepID=A0A6J2T5K7_DROLE|nr:tissue inhibitor of metalloproteinase [Scaptodrosophila lebanonensis]XP_030370218.1 tissue inhibitor of metalloproteinase [Scaptodrosophila lebanonensis]